MFSTPLYRLNIVDRPLAKGKGEASPCLSSMQSHPRCSLSSMHLPLSCKENNGCHVDPSLERLVVLCRSASVRSLSSSVSSCSTAKPKCRTLASLNGGARGHRLFASIRHASLVRAPKCGSMHGPCHATCRLEDIGFGVGLRLLEILCFREKNSKRDVRLLDILKFVHSTLWKYLFGRQARDLEQSNTVCGKTPCCHTPHRYCQPVWSRGQLAA